MREFEAPEIIYRDEDLLVVNKPAGLLSQQSLDKRRPHVVSWVERHLGVKAALHHRLDKDTSGVLVLGLSKRVNAKLTDLFRDHEMRKTYWALAKPRPEDARTEFSVLNHVAPVRDAKKKLLRMVEVRSGGWKAETDFRVLARAEGFDWIEAKPKTGRTHQIRIHLAGVKRPIWGDFLYGGKNEGYPRLMLHARVLEFPHPFSGDTLELVAPAPADFRAFLERVPKSVTPES
ncbi:MAG: RluA family pseudouridine synthase [Bdellovibrionaceae bacterium]|nr:RluA family pseudouridine synthase [Pseudobdellovibrionaceae bacterium]